MTDLTRLLDAIRHGDAEAAGELLALVYAELRRLAAAKMTRGTMPILAQSPATRW